VNPQGGNSGMVNGSVPDGEVLISLKRMNRVREVDVLNDAMTLAQDALAAEQRSELLMPMYAMLLLFFFVYCYPIARWTIRLERRYAVKI
jgi:hypothetical protein